MASNFHESYTGTEIKPPSERSTGLVFATVALTVAVLWRDDSTVFWVAFAVAIGLVAVSLFAPFVLKPLNILWFRLGLLMHRIVNPIIMFAIFAFVFMPGGLIMRLWRDPLKSQRMPSASSYWIDRKPSEDTAASMTNQF